MDKYKVKLIWKAVYEFNVEANNAEEAEDKALQQMERAEGILVDEYYSDAKITKI